jgi:hypothetical protein
MTLECKIGYSHQWLNAYFQVNFWCGFCKKVIQADHDPHKQVGSGGSGSGSGKGQDDNDPANHRWDHIDAHFKMGMMMESWVFWEAKKTRGEVANKTRGEVENLKDAKFVFSVYGHDNAPKEERRKERPKASISQPQVGEKRKAEGELVRHERRPRGRYTKEMANWNCVSLLHFPFISSGSFGSSKLTSYKCECFNGPISVKLHASCPGRENNCSHIRCERCQGNYANDGGEEEVLAIGPYDSWRDGHAESPLAEKIMDYHEKGREVIG